MNLFRSQWPKPSLGRLYPLALVLLGLLAAVALLQTDRSVRQIDRAGKTAFDAARLMHVLVRLVDDARGLEALHLLQDDPAERQAIEQRLTAQRGALFERLQDRAVATDAGQQRCIDALRASLATYWAVQDRLLEASRQAHRDRRDAALAASARGLLNGESEQAWRGVIDALERWWQVRSDAARAASLERIWQRLVLPVGLAALLVLVMLALLRSEGQAAPEPRGPGPDGERRGTWRSAAASAARNPERATPTAVSAAEAQAAPVRQQVLRVGVTRARGLYLVGGPGKSDAAEADSGAGGPDPNPARSA